MKIISKEQDFYDSVLYQFGYNDDLLFNRQTGFHKGLNDRFDKLRKSLYPMYMDRKINVSQYGFEDKMCNANICIQPIIFCGKVYFYEATTLTSATPINLRRVDDGSLFVPDKPWGRYLDREDLISITKSLAKTRPWYQSKTELGLYEWHELLDIDFSEMLVDVGAAYFVFETDKYGNQNNSNSEPYIHPLLKNFQFAKAVDPFSAAQQVEQFVSMHLTNKSLPPIIIADKHRVTAHGFDKYSFRNTPKK